MRGNISLIAVGLAALCLVSGCSSDASDQTSNPAAVAQFKGGNVPSAEQQVQFSQDLQANIRKKHPELFTNQKAAAPAPFTKAAAGQSAQQ